MRLFHVSEESTITSFVPRTPQRDDLDPSIPLVWAISEECLPNFLTPRDCPRVAYHIGPDTTEEDASAFLAPTFRHCVAIERGWLPRLMGTTLHLYEFDPTAFVLQDAVAGYYVSTSTQTPIGRRTIENPLQELLRRHVEVRLLPSLWPLGDAVQKTTLHWSLCRMRNAQPRA